ncbi:hypothetical protein [Nocardioides sp.]|uniref:hypothetical protein n=1 Tax=Nocardioides sp. TaxID=35761 RepID=UPI00356361E9
MPARPLMVLVVLLLAGCADGESSRSQDGAAAPDAELIPYVEVERGPIGVTATDDGDVWVVSAYGDALSRIPSGADEPDLVAEVAGTPLRATAAFGRLWVTSFERNRLLRLDLETGEVTGTLKTGAGPEGVTAGFGSIWVVVQDAGELLRVDPATLEVQDRISIGAGARLVATGPDAVYVSHYADGAVLRLDPTTAKITAARPACEGPQGMAVLGDRIWVVCTLADEVVSLDARTLAIDDIVAVKGSPDSIQPTPDGRLAVVAEDGPTLVMVDVARAQVSSRTTLGDERPLDDRANLDLVIVAGEAWVSSYNADRVYHVPLPD